MAVQIAFFLGFSLPAGARHLRLTHCLGDDFDQVDACTLVVAFKLYDIRQ